MRGFASDPIENRDGTDPVECPICEEDVSPLYLRHAEVEDEQHVGCWRMVRVCGACAIDLDRQNEAAHERQLAAFYGSSRPQTDAERMVDAYHALAARRK